jgi:hypothetical protein
MSAEPQEREDDFGAERDPVVMSVEPQEREGDLAAEVAPEDALRALAAQLRTDDSVISPHVADPGAAEPALGLLVAAGPRAATAPGEYAQLIESIREGYLLHYAEPRLIAGADRDLALLAGDYLYARGLERLAALGDLEAVRELSDLISLSAQLNAGSENHGGPDAATAALWLASVTVTAAGPEEGHEQAKSALRAGDPSAPASLWEAAGAAASRAGIRERLERAAEAIGFQPR